METIAADKSTFIKWVDSFNQRNINVGPINETLIKLFEDVEKISLSESDKKEILNSNS